ncbi:hypothetical protein QFC21_004354 [Naganishia friedmannii]|uniref:Uncharacterized protein n=1 Tax=Naganishia friedmannii TaxID=89922 RepID=A0ACC2VHY7_9TREE|nr:hypothetical protein QFC21_004354 [Naganishia friedmannii]
MSHPSNEAITSSLLSALLSLRATPPRIIQSPPTQPRRASVALIIRLKPSVGLEIPPQEYGTGSSIEEFFRLRGRHEQTDDSSHYTALRETWEEIGLDLADKEYLSVGRLDDREITTSLGKRLLMILSPFVFLQISPISPPADLQPAEVASLHWIPIATLIPPFPKAQWSNVQIDISSRLSPRNKLVRLILRGLVGNMNFGCVLLPDDPEVIADGFNPEFLEDRTAQGGGTIYGPDGRRQLRLWGLTLGMTLDLLAHLPQDGTIPVVRRMSLMEDEKERYDVPVGFEPRTPVTVTSSFEEKWLHGGVSTPTQGGHVPLPQVTGDTSGANGRQSVQAKDGKEKEMAGATWRVDHPATPSVRPKSVLSNRRGVGPGITSVFPRFSYPDVNFWIWVFGRRYRRVVRGWEASVSGPPRAADRRINWSGAALAAFYAAVRQALVVAIIIRALATAFALGGVGWWMYQHWYSTTL